jgi:N-acetylmuramoyl-L-alanine amidase
MAYTLLTSHAGHTIGGGARGSGYEESAVARQFNELLIKAFKNVGQSVVDTTDNIGRTQSQNLANLVRNCNNHPKSGRLDISLHLNSGGGTGVEVLYYDQQALAAKVSKAIANVTGLRDRGAKQRKDLYVLAKTNAPAILIELSFIDNQNDMNALMCKMQEVANAIVESTTGKMAKTVTKSKIIITGGLKPQSVMEFAEFVNSKGWWARVTFEKDYGVGETGGLSGRNLIDCEAFMKERNWWYQVKEV